MDIWEISAGVSSRRGFQFHGWIASKLAQVCVAISEPAADVFIFELTEKIVWSPQL